MEIHRPRVFVFSFKILPIFCSNRNNVPDLHPDFVWPRVYSSYQNIAHRMDIEAIGLVLRVAVPSLVPSIVDSVASVEVTTPITSFRSLKEAFYYLKYGLNLYDGGVNHHAPILVVLLSFVDQLPFNNLAFNVLYALADWWTARRLAALNRWYASRYGPELIELTTKTTGITKEKTINSGSENNESETDSKEKGTNNSDDIDSEVESVAVVTTPVSDRLIKAFFLLNPLLILTNWSHNTLVFVNLLVIESIYQVCVNQSQISAVMVLAFATYLNYTPVYLIAPILGLGFANTSRKAKYSVIEGGDGRPLLFSPWERLAQTFAVFISSVVLLLLCLFAMTSSTQFVDHCYLVPILFRRISPNLGLWWYFFTEMFEFFTPFFTGVFNLFSILFVVPITLRFNDYTNLKGQINTGDAFFAVFASYLWLVFTKLYPAVGDFGLILSMIPIFRSTFLPYCTYGPIAALVLLVALILSPIFYYCWIVLGNGNSNFFYSINLVWGIVHGLVIMDMLWGKLTFDYVRVNEVSKEQQKVLRLAQG